MGIHKYLTFIFLITIFQFAFQQNVFSEEVGGYEIGTWYRANKDKSVRFRLRWDEYQEDEKENVPTYVMETTFNALPDKVAVPILNYAGYTKAKMPRMYESTRLHSWNHVSLNWVEGKQKKLKRTFRDVSLVIVRFKLNIDYLPDAEYTLALVNYKEPVSGIIRVYWIQYDEDNYNKIKNISIKRYANRRASRLRLPKPDDSDKYPNNNEDLYGSWMLIPQLATNQTFVHYESYADPGFWGRRVMGTVIENSLIDMIKIMGIIRKNIPKK